MAKTKMYKFREATNKWWDMVGLMDGTWDMALGTKERVKVRKGGQ